MFRIRNLRFLIIFSFQMLALSPSVFDLLSDRLVPTDRWTAERHPAVHYGILFSLYGHCSRHGHFMSSSSLLSSLTAVTVATINRTTSKNFSSILRVLASVVGHSKASFDVQCLCLKWVYEIVSGLRSSPHVLVIDCFLDIIRAVIGVGGSVTGCCVTFTLIRSSCMGRMVACSLYSVQVTMERVR